MKLKAIYESIVEQGIKNDPRGEKAVKKLLKETKKGYNNLPKKEKKLFDKERLISPYSDTRILNGKPSTEVKTILAGIDMETPEVLLADSLKKRGKKIDLILAHHPEGPALSALYGVMDIQVGLLESAGVSRKKAKKLVDERITEIKRKLHSGNVMRPVEAAKLLGIPLMCAHTAADNCVQDYLRKMVDKSKPKKVRDLIDLLLKEPEYRHSEWIGTGPRLILGKPSNKCGKVIVEMTGGTGGPKKMFPELVKAGVKTIMSMHMSEENFKKAKKHSLNVLIAGHICSDSLGVNLILGAIDPKDKLNIIPCSGFIRVDRRPGK